MRVYSVQTVILVLLGAMTLRASAADGIVVDKQLRTVIIDASVAPRKLPNLDQVYPIEVVAAFAAPRGQKAHETIVTIEAEPSAVHKALESLGLKPGTPVKGDGEPRGPEVNVYLEVPGPDGEPRRVGIERFLLDPKTGKPMPKVKWRFTGSVQSKVAPDKEETTYGANLTGTLIALFPVTDQTVLQSSLTMKEEKYLKLETDKRVLPKELTPVKLIIEVPAGQ